MGILDESKPGRDDYEPAAPLLDMEEQDLMVPPSRLRRSHRMQRPEPHLNITSFVDVLAVLMFFLLTVATLEKLGTHDVDLPTQTETFAEESDVEVKNLSVSLARDGLTLRGLLTPEGRDPEVLKIELPILEDKYDVERLRQELLTIKETYRSDEAIILMVSDDVHFDWIVRVMDAVRERVEYRNGQQLVTVLFPEISLSDYLLDFDPEAADESAESDTDEVAA